MNTRTFQALLKWLLGNQSEPLASIGMLHVSQSQALAWEGPIFRIDWLRNHLNCPGSCSRYWTETSLQMRPMQGVLLRVNDNLVLMIHEPAWQASSKSVEKYSVLLHLTVNFSCFWFISNLSSLNLGGYTLGRLYLARLQFKGLFPFKILKFRSF